MSNDIITVTSPLLPDLGEFNAMLQDIWSRKWITNMGHYHEELEAALAEYLGVEYISLFTNGTLPLITALQALGITKGEVITTPYSFVATSHAIWWNGLKPVFVDIDPNTGNIDPTKIEAAITPDTVAILPVHVYGCPCDVEAIDAIAKRHNLKVIYDAAHAFGVKVKASPKSSPKGKDFTVSFASTWGIHTADSTQYELLGKNAKLHRADQTEAEEIMWGLLKANRLGAHFRRQHVILDYIVDFFCAEKGLTIELDGGYHNDLAQKEYDEARTRHLTNLGYTELRFTNSELLCNPDGVIAQIKETLEELPSLRLSSLPFREGSGLGWQSVLQFGDISTLSFHATKVFNTIEGGALVCHSKEMKEKIDHLKNFGFEDEVTVVAPGINSKMDEMRAAYGLLNLRQVDAAIAARKHVAEQYVAALKDVKGIHLFPYEIEQASSQSINSSFSAADQSIIPFKWNFAYFPILVTDDYSLPFREGQGVGLSPRDTLYEHMKSQGVLGRRYFYPLITDFEPYKNLVAPPNNHPSLQGGAGGRLALPTARRIADQVICLPMHHALSEEDVKRVINCIVK